MQPSPQPPETLVRKERTLQRRPSTCTVPWLRPALALVLLVAALPHPIARAQRTHAPAANVHTHRHTPLDAHARAHTHPHGAHPKTTSAAPQPPRERRRVKIFVAPLPDFFDPATDRKCDRFPRDSFNADSIAAIEAGDSPFGTRVDGIPGAWTTGQYVADVIFHRAILGACDRLCVADVAHADVVYVPFLYSVVKFCYPASEDVVRAWTDRLSGGGAANVTDGAAAVRYFLQNLAEFLPQLGTLPHFGVLGRQQREVQFSRFGPRSLMMDPAAQKVAWGMLEPFGRRPKPGSRVSMWAFNYLSDHMHGQSANIVTIPYPSYWHGPFNDDPSGHGRFNVNDCSEDRSWNLSIDADPQYDDLIRLRSAVGSHAHPPISICFGGRDPSDRVGYIRSKLRDDCLARADLCADACAGMLLGDVAINSALRRSKVCIQPLGDTPTRKALFDCLGVGAVPVVVQDTPFVLHAWPYQELTGVDPSSFLGYVDFGAAVGEAGGVHQTRAASMGTARGQAPNLIELISHAYDDDTLQSMRASFLRVRNVTFYSTDPQMGAVRLDTLHKIDPQRDDATTAGLKELIISAYSILR